MYYLLVLFKYGLEQFFKGVFNIKRLLNLDFAKTKNKERSKRMQDLININKLSFVKLHPRYAWTRYCIETNLLSTAEIFIYSKVCIFYH